MTPEELKADQEEVERDLELRLLSAVRVKGALRDYSAIGSSEDTEVLRLARAKADRRIREALAAYVEGEEGDVRVVDVNKQEEGAEGCLT